jgi:diamine N-acetyltransferase
MKVRIAKKKDISALIDLMDQQHQFHEHLRPDVFHLVPNTTERITQILQNDKEDIIVSEIAGKIEGIIQLRYSETKDIPILVKKKYVYVQEMYVSDGFRRKGIGTKLLKRAKSWAQKHGADYMRTSCLPNNSEALDFYEKSGFTPFMYDIELKL